jgi:2-keto-3-deoxy-L-rhamnonate aldolase RhmA
MPNRIKEALDGSGVAYGTWAQMVSPEFCEIAARSGSGDRFMLSAGYCAIQSSVPR